MFRRCWPLGTLLAFSGLALPARAATPASANAVQLGIGVRYGFEMESIGLNPWGFGAGASAGYTLGNAIYFGGNLDYFIGESKEGRAGATHVKVSTNIWQLMAEGGYDVGLGDQFVVRPKLGAGIVNTRNENCASQAGFGSCLSESQMDFAIAPGASFIQLSRPFSFAIDLRYAMIFSDPASQNALLLTVGIGF